jgi:hypothetical protein
VEKISRRSSKQQVIMFGSQILEVAIGVIFVFVLVSTMCSMIREGIEAWLKTRAAYLEYGIRELLHDKQANGIAQSFYTHPLIYSLYSAKYRRGRIKDKPGVLTKGHNLPSYIPAKNFALALMDIAARGPADKNGTNSDAQAPSISLDSIRSNIAHIGNPAVQRVLLTAIDSAQGDLNRAQANIEAWYDSGMDRVSGWYKRSTQTIIFCIGLVISIGLNVNTITIGDYLYRNDMARAAIVARAEAAAKDPKFRNDYQAAKAELESVRLPIGWSDGWGAPRPGYDWTRKSFAFWNHLFGPIIGWLLTAFAVTLGAPFWFDILNKVMVIRSTVKPHEKSPEEGSEDRRPRSSKPAPPSD